jgi:hypothetical protein
MARRSTKAKASATPVLNEETPPVPIHDSTAKRNIAEDIDLEDTKDDKKPRLEATLGPVKASIPNPYVTPNPYNAAAGATLPEDATGYHVFICTGGKEVVQAGEDATNFRCDWADAILSSRLFPTEDEAKSYVRTLQPSPPGTPISSIIDVDAVPRTPLSASSEAKLSEVIASLQDKKPGNRINLLYRTNAASSACVVLIECINMTGKHQWNVKPELLCEPIQVFAREFPEDPDAVPIIADSALAFCFHNIKKHVLRDTSAGPDAPLQTKWVSPDKSKEITYDQYIMGTNFTIPVETLASTQEEDKFITDKLQMFGACFKKVLASPLFERLHEANCPKESIWKSMNGKGPKTGGFSFLDYVNDATVHVSKCTNLNSYVTKEEADTLMTVLWKGRSPGSNTKY